ncbi:hypothetical protein PAXRUDRAFT_609926 [Paxillus rubicundulus Ve08.2h10]|uniref:Uncharacterized protein n=1 Tax=Paxillus rubicundulus Ve08.2h10 TaxID=930991 RepID=A0A0D0E3Z7_9AGAM|nr:hypothetical protein PAXRUDRAFT_609926 [Paxillus rubicundulus Ve08.2h10]
MACRSGEPTTRLPHRTPHTLRPYYSSAFHLGSSCTTVNHAHQQLPTFVSDLLVLRISSFMAFFLIELILPLK